MFKKAQRIVGGTRTKTVLYLTGRSTTHCHALHSTAARLNVSSFQMKGTVSMCTAFDNIKCAHRLIQVGAFLHGTHCHDES